MSVGQIDSKPVPFPDTWASSADGQFCLVCRRERAAKAALESAPDCSLAARAQLRRAALIEFEVRRTPDHSDGMIAKACHSSVSAVAKARTRLRLPTPPPTTGRRANHREPARR
ncbi:MAG: hypothetical protein WD827_04995 [Solirubrobacterales bacterium]